jgi:hypothetical protein
MTGGLLHRSVNQPLDYLQVIELPQLRMWRVLEATIDTTPTQTHCGFTAPHIIDSFTLEIG